MRDGDDRGPVGWLRWFWNVEEGPVMYVREVLTSVAAVLLVGALLFAVSGIWPPMVAVESGSMQPHMQRGDLVFVMEEHRLAPRAAHGDTGVVTYRVGRETGYSKFGAPGDVIVYQPGGDGRFTPIIHRARFWVNESENWYDKADKSAVGSADSCSELRNCPAPHAGFITKGDNEATNRNYDQVSGLSPPVRPAWVVGTAEFRIPLLGNIRLWAASAQPGSNGVHGTVSTGIHGTASTVEPDRAVPGDAGTGSSQPGAPPFVASEGFDSRRVDPAAVSTHPGTGGPPGGTPARGGAHDTRVPGERPVGPGIAA